MYNFSGVVNYTIQLKGRNFSVICFSGKTKVINKIIVSKLVHLQRHQKLHNILKWLEMAIRVSRVKIRDPL